MTVAVYSPPAGLSEKRIAFKRSASPLTTGTLWTFTGGILVERIVGVVRTIVQAQATTVQLQAIVDALTAVDFSTNGLDLNAAAVGSILQMPAAGGSAMVKAANGAATGLALGNTPKEMICTTSGVIRVTYGAASTGVIDWYMLWQKLTADATVV